MQSGVRCFIAMNVIQMFAPMHICMYVYTYIYIRIRVLNICMAVWPNVIYEVLCSSIVFQLPSMSDSPAEWIAWRTAWDAALCNVASIGLWRRQPRWNGKKIMPAAEERDERCWSPKEFNFLEWLQFASWHKCSTCGMMHRRSLTQAELLKPAKALRSLSAKCYGCKTHGPELSFQITGRRCLRNAHFLTFLFCNRCLEIVS
jgi:hypothetical protein